MKSPILLTLEGDVLTHYPEATPDDSRALHTCIGVHALCHGFVDFAVTSRTHSALRCRSCGLRVPVPAEVRTFGQLREDRNRNVFEQAVRGLNRKAGWPEWAELPEPGQKIVCVRANWPFPEGMEGVVIAPKPWPTIQLGTWVQWPEAITSALGKGPRWLMHGEIGMFGAFEVTP